MHKLISSEIYEVQREYLLILNSLVKHFSKSNIYSAIDNISIFWHSHKKITSLFLNYLDQNSLTYLFTGASYLNIKDNNHYPFVSLGNIHIVDDPLCKFAKIYPRIEAMPQQSFYLEYIMCAAIDIISIIENLNRYILVLPVTFGFHEDDQTIHDMSTRSFLSLFKEEFTSINEYISTIVTIDDVYNKLKDEYKNNLPMGDSIPAEEGLIKNFNELKETIPPYGAIPYSDAFLFYTHMSGIWSQAHDILLCCLKFGLIPFIRSETSFYYTLSAANNFLEIPTIKDINFRMTSAYILYNSYPEGFKHIEFEKYYAAVMYFNFDSRLDTLHLQYLNTIKLSFREIQSVIKTCFTQLAESLKAFQTKPD